VTSPIVIAIDGPSASGKSTVARRTAERLGFVHVDSGALYRAVTWEALKNGLNPCDAAVVAAHAARLQPDFDLEGPSAVIRLGDLATVDLRSPSVREHVSEIAANPAVRVLITGWLRGLIRFGNLVMEGRDIGSVVFPNATFKFFLDASADERARRRWTELQAAREAVALGEIRQSLDHRDEHDRQRSDAPLAVAPGAEVIDTTSLTIDQVVDHIVGRMARS
jgi:CMP/dCMP kinase